MTILVRAGAALVLSASTGCHVPGVVLSLDADGVVGPKLDSYCLALTAGGKRGFGQRYSIAEHALPETLGVKSDGKKEMVARLEGYSQGVRVATAAQSFALTEKQPALTLSACVSSGLPVSAPAFHPRNGIMKIADHLAFARTGLEAPGASTLIAAGTGVGIAATYSNGALQQTATPTPSGQVGGLVAIDYDADCADDVVLSTSGGAELAWSDANDGTFSTDSSRLPATLGAASVIVSADVNGDGFADLVGVGTGSTANFVLLSDGKRAFSTSPGFDTAPMGGQAAALGDVDGDGMIDVVVGGPQTSARWWKGDGSGRFVLTGQPIDATNVASLALTDLDGDGSLDIVAAVTSGGPGLHVLLNDGHGSFTDRTPAWVPGTLDDTGLAVAVVDVDGDCANEILFGGSTSAARLLGVRNGQLQDRGAIGNLPTHALGAADLDGDGLPEVVLLTFSDIEIWSQSTGSGS